MHVLQVEGLCMMVNKVIALLQVAEDKTAKLFVSVHSPFLHHVA